jgi:hypothetical protein
VRVLIGRQLLTASMVGGWSLLWLTLARYTALGGFLGLLGGGCASSACLGGGN